MATLPIVNIGDIVDPSTWGNVVRNKLQEGTDTDVKIKGQSVTAKDMATIKIASEFAPTGDGSPSNPWNYQGITLASAALGSTPGGVYINAGNWVHPSDGTDIIIPSNQSWFGAGYGKISKIDLGGTGLNPFYFNGSSYSSLSNVYITKARQGVGFTGCNNIRVEHVIVEEGTVGEVYSFGASGTTSNVYLFDCEGYGFGSGHGAHNYALFDVGTHRNWHFLRCYAQAAGQNGFVLYSNTSNEINYVECRSKAHGISGFWSRDGDLRNRYIACEAVDGFDVLSQYGNIASGFNFQAPNAGSEIIGGLAQGNEMHGVVLQQGVDNAIVSGIHCVNNSTKGAGIGFGMYLNTCINSTITNNTFNDYQGIPTQTQAIGFYGTTNNIISNNAGKYGSIKYPIGIPSPSLNVARGNVGTILTDNGGIASVANGGTIAHGIANLPAFSSPYFAVVNPSVSKRIAAITAKDTTNVTVSLHDDAGNAIVTPENVYWYVSVFRP